eukprot:18720-Pleurochrysis_carterae.AAC.2
MQPPSRREAPCRLRPSSPHRPLSLRASPYDKKDGWQREHRARLLARCLRHSCARVRKSARLRPMLYADKYVLPEQNSRIVPLGHTQMTSILLNLVSSPNLMEGGTSSLAWPSPERLIILASQLAIRMCIT